MAGCSSFDFASLFDGSSATNTVNLCGQTHDWNRICHQFKSEVMWTETYFLWVNEWNICSVLVPTKGLLRARSFCHSDVTASCAIVQFT